VPAIRTATVTLRGGLAFEAQTGSGHSVSLDASADHGGADGGASPMELLLVSLGGCTAMDVISMLKKMRLQVTAYRVEVRGTRRDEHPQIYTQIDVEHVVAGHDLDPGSIARAVELSSTKYCPVSAMLAAAADVRHSYRIEGAPTPD
jgi:putative redox protein